MPCNGLCWEVRRGFCGVNFGNPDGHIATILDANTATSRLETIVLECEVDPTITKFSKALGPVIFDLSMLNQLSVFLKLKMFCFHLKMPAFPLFADPYSVVPPCMQQYMQDLATAVSEVGGLIIKGGQETTTSLDSYYAELSMAYMNLRDVPRSTWRYTIEQL